MENLLHDKEMEDLTRTLTALNILSSMITPAVLISACGTLVFSTSTRLGRIVDRVRVLSSTIEELSKNESTLDFPEERFAEVERQLLIHARRSRLIQQAVTSFYVALSAFVAAMVAIGYVAVFKQGGWMPNLLGIVGTLFMLYGCMTLIVETRLALRAVNYEMAFTLMLRSKYQQRRVTGQLTL
ncbi:MAG TPA: DUF2721 domain-containing protein [Blastocatellia bacterium]|nr:DUF2721 domain-containing protein [Blastocatellia bacterium]